jgi:hypothetical protein
MTAPKPIDEVLCVTSAINEGARQEGKFMVVCIAPDVCLTPPVPVPYQIVAFLDNSMNVSPNVRFTCKPALMMKSRGIQVIGDEAGLAALPLN